MREFIKIITDPILTEGSVERITVWSGATIPVLHNPSKIAFENFAKKHRAIRGLLTYSGNDVWLWNAGQAVHTNLIQELGLDRIDCIFYTDGRWSGDFRSSDDREKYVPAIQRITPYVPRPRTKEDEELLNQILNDPMFADIRANAREEKVTEEEDLEETLRSDWRSRFYRELDRLGKIPGRVERAMDAARLSAEERRMAREDSMAMSEGIQSMRDLISKVKREK